jgi:hypothetical protein
MRRLNVSTLAIAIALAAAGTAAGQPPKKLQLPAPTLDFIGPEIPLGPIVRGAPFSADASTSVTQLLGDGTRINRTVTAKLFRDGDGRVRREQTILGLAAVDPSDESQRIITILDPVAGVTYVLDPRTHRARRTPLALRERRPEAPPPPPLPGEQPRRVGERLETLPNPPQPLGTKQIEGLDVVGTRRTETIPAGRIGNDRAFDIVDERWESPALKLLVQSQHHDPRTGDVEYRLTNISRADQPYDLFAVPADYTIVDTPDRVR